MRTAAAPRPAKMPNIGNGELADWVLADCCPSGNSGGCSPFVGGCCPSGNSGGCSPFVGGCCPSGNSGGCSPVRRISVCDAESSADATPAIQRNIRIDDKIIFNAVFLVMLITVFEISLQYLQHHTKEAEREPLDEREFFHNNNCLLMNNNFPIVNALNTSLKCADFLRQTPAAASSRCSYVLSDHRNFLQH